MLAGPSRCACAATSARSASARIFWCRRVALVPVFRRHSWTSSAAAGDFLLPQMELLVGECVLADTGSERLVLRHQAEGCLIRRNPLTAENGKDDMTLFKRRQAPVLRLLAAAIILAFAAPSALADTKSVVDPADGGGMDVIEASHHHGATRGVLVHRIRMAEPWSNADLVRVSINIRLWKNSTKPDRRVSVDVNEDGSLSAVVLGRTGRVLGHGSAWRSDDTTLQVEFTKRTLRRRITSYRWRTEVIQPCTPEGQDCAIEFDFAPDRGQPLVLHRLY